MSTDDLQNRPPDANVNGDAAADALVDRLTAALRDRPVPDGPDEQTLAATLAALRAAEVSPPHIPGGALPITQHRRNRSMKPLLKLALAACLVLVGGVVFLAAPWGNSLAFAKVVNQVKQAESVRYKAQMTVTLPGGKAQTVESTTLVVGNRLRQELPNVVQLLDFESGEMLTLQPREKKAMRFTMKDMPRDASPVNLLNEFRVMDPEKAKDIGVREFDGRKLRGFEVDKSGQHMTVWVDPGTQSPERIEITIDVPSAPRTAAVMTDFVWDPADRQEITMDVPADYKVQSMEMDASPPAEKDLVEGLRALATVNGGTFPATFDMAAIGEAVKARANDEREKTPERAEALQSELMPQVMKIGRALAFVTPANGTDWHYAGAGAKLGEPGRAVMWYRPAGADTYRVIHADLSVRDAKTEELPKLDAKPLSVGAPSFPATTEPAKAQKR